MNVKKFFLIFGLILLAALAAFAGVVVGLISSKPFAMGDHGNALAEVGADGVVNFLLVGKDHVGANTDVIMVISLNPQTEKISILSVPRDTRISLNGSRKINSVYSYAEYRGMRKEEALIDTVSEVTRLPIHYYAIINLRAFRDVVDELGGVDYYVERPYHYDDPFQDLHIHIDPGQQTLNGAQAEGLIRYRHDYAMGDIERVGVQQNFIMAFLQQKLQMKYVSKIPEVYEKVTDNVISNLKVSDVLTYAKAVMGYQTETFLLPGMAGDGSGYWIQDDAETDRLIQEKF
ncbi:MAG: LytR family transcriptional regulator [Ruminococcaceae bacterium]|nr:LytR family transcriptional regulator [Oscillospiraceae bacterium]